MASVSTVCHSDVIAVQLDRPARQRPLAGIPDVVEVGVVPGRAVQHGEAGDAADVDRDAGARRLRGVVPGDHAGVRDHRADREAWVEHGPEPEHHDSARRQRPVDRGVVGGDRRAGDADARRRAVHRRRPVHVGELAGLRRVEVVGDDDVDGRHRAMFVDASRRIRAVAPGSAGPPPTTVTCFVIESCWPAPTTTTVGSGPVAGLPSPSVSRFGSSTLSHHGLVADQRAGRRAGIDAQVELEDRRGSGRDRAGARTGSGGVRSDELMLMPEASGETPPSGWPTGSPLSIVESAT